MDSKTSGSRSSSVFRERDAFKSCDIPAVIDEILANESDSSDASWMADFEQDSDKEQSDCDEVESVPAAPAASKRKEMDLKFDIP